MPEFCDVALPVPLEMTFTYRVGEATPVVGGRVLVPFRTTRLSGIVTALHDTPPSVKAKSVIIAIDAAPVFDEALLKLGNWIAQYYIAPIGEVFRTMLPLMAEVKQQWMYTITETGHTMLYESATVGSSRRSKKSVDEQMLEYEVLNHLASAGEEAVREQTLRSATGAKKATLADMLRKKWIAREDTSHIRDASRTVRVAVLRQAPAPPDAKEAKKLNDNQQVLLLALTVGGGRVRIEEMHRSCSQVPRTTLQTLVKRGLVEIVEEPADFSVSSMHSKEPLGFTLNVSQKSALEKVNAAVEAGKFSVSLLHGVTGSGKTAIYLSAMQQVLAAGRAAVLLVPEIGLTPAAAANLYRIFGEQVAILHSALSNDERAEQWHRIHNGDARIVVGTRSAVFAPVRDLALIVVDEEHDSSYKQEETPRYNARDVAVMRGKLSGAAVVLGSATPSLESFHNSQKGKYALIELRDRVEARPMPEVEIVDLRQEFQQTGEDQIFSRRLLEELGQRLVLGEQAIVLLNRRGYSAVVLCRSCGETVQCKNCAIAMTHHKGSPRLECHYCGYRLPVPHICPKCNSEHIYFLGTGSEKVEDRLHTAFPQARIGRLDRDTVRGRHDFERVLNQLNAGELDILVGTQMVAKGHDIHGVTLVGVVGADFALGFPDFRAAERTFQLLTQVAGRAGRGSTPGKVILQTFYPEHYAIQFAQQHDFNGFAAKELQYRRWMHYPPFTAVANLLIRSDKLDLALRYSGDIGKWVTNTRMEGVRVMGPAAAPISRLKRDYRYHFVLKAQSREKLNAVLRALLNHAAEREIPRTNIIADVDALSLL
ncbi:MAG: primosomal protein [Candidatus Angelobacter sp.]|jgi:primosomal protein N' (replication factor Y)|nr:primosomal protein [Candidatus Angelobacter sp.]